MLTRIHEKAKYCRAFETVVFEQIKKGNINIPTYLSAGQEFIPATISVFCEEIGVKPLIFGQHRAHSTYLCFGGDVVQLIDELLGLSTGCAGGMGGSASIHSPDINMFGHDGLMGSNVPIGTGACFAKREPTIVFVGDAAAEEDYALSSYGWAATKQLPILYVVEDNNLSILTEKRVRRSWEISPVASAMGLDAATLEDSPARIIEALGLNWNFKTPKLLNIETVRLFWHAGAGVDGEPRDLLKDVNIETEVEFFRSLWEDRLNER